MGRGGEKDRACGEKTPESGKPKGLARATSAHVIHIRIGINSYDFLYGFVTVA